MGLEIKGFAQSHTNYVGAGTGTYFSASAYFIQTDVCYKCITRLLNADRSILLINWPQKTKRQPHIYLTELQTLKLLVQVESRCNTFSGKFGKICNKTLNNMSTSEGNN